MIQKNVCATAGRPNKGVKQDAFLVLRETSMPACLIELGYITTAKEEDYLNNKANIDALGKGIYQAFLEYKKKHDKSPAVQQPVQQEEQPAPSVQPAEVPVKPEKEEQPAKPEKEDQPVQTQQVKPEKEEQPAKPAESEQPAKPQKEEPKVDSDAPVFKVQFLTSGTRLKAGCRQFKGLTSVESYKEGSVWKYTVGSSNDYQAIQSLRRDVAKQFPEAFIVAFRHGERMDINEAREIYKKSKKK